MLIENEIIIETNFRSYFFDASTKRKNLLSGLNARLRTKWGPNMLNLMVLDNYQGLHIHHRFHYISTSLEHFPYMLYLFFIIEKLVDENDDFFYFEKNVVGVPSR